MLVAKELGISIPKTQFEYKVEDLEDISTVDIDFDKLLKVDFGQYNGYASPSVEIDYFYLENVVVKDFVNNFYRNTSNWTVKQLITGDSEDWFYAEFDQYYSNLKNGDKIKVNIVLNEGFTQNGVSLADFEAGMGVDLHGGTITYTVKGLEEPKNVIDIFEDIEQYVAYNGANGTGYTAYTSVPIPQDYFRQIGDFYFYKGSYSNSIKIIHNNTNVGEIAFNVDAENLTGGDIVEIKAHVSS